MIINYTIYYLVIIHENFQFYYNMVSEKMQVLLQKFQKFKISETENNWRRGLHFYEKYSIIIRLFIFLILNLF